MYVYTRTVTNAPSCGESNAITVKVKVNSAMTATPTHAASTHIWTTPGTDKGTLHWSDAIKHAQGAIDPTCTFVDLPNGASFSTSNTTLAQWGTKTVVEKGVNVTRYYYSWTCATAAAATLCDNDWHLPTESELVSLRNTYILVIYKDDPLLKDQAYGEGGRILGEHPDFAWGYGGIVSGSAFNDVSTIGYYWSSTEGGTNNIAHRLIFYSSGRLGTATNPKYDGFQVRCVKNN
jgi:uncharacterized protein (TIGR02145 family)